MAAGADAGKVSAGFDGEGEADGGLGNFFSYFALELKSQKQSFKNLLFFLGGGLMYGFMIHPILKFKTGKCRKEKNSDIFLGVLLYFLSKQTKH